MKVIFVPGISIFAGFNMGSLWIIRKCVCYLHNNSDLLFSINPGPAINATPESMNGIFSFFPAAGFPSVDLIILLLGAEYIGDYKFLFEKEK